MTFDMFICCMKSKNLKIEQKTMHIDSAFPKLSILLILELFLITSSLTNASVFNSSGSTVPVLTA